MYFQKTRAFDPKDKNNILNTGLIHQDGDYPIVGLVYLTEGADVDSGTSITVSYTHLTLPTILLV